MSSPFLVFLSAYVYQAAGVILHSLVPDLHLPPCLGALSSTGLAVRAGTWFPNPLGWLVSDASRASPEAKAAPGPASRALDALVCSQ